jgi:hypothetical protein
MIVEWNIYLATSRALKTQHIAAIDELKHDTLGFVSTSCHALLNHLQNTYARITPAQLNKNEQELSREWDPSQVPIENLWVRVKECRRPVVSPPPATTPSPKPRVYEKSSTASNEPDSSKTQYSIGAKPL